jgi:Pentapeptide repeats (8 copies)
MTELRADCSRCFALCCVALPFKHSSDFAFDKPADTPCRHLAGDFRCGIHDRLPGAGFAGCARFDCFGAGQRVAQVTFGGRDWQTHPEVAAPMFRAFTIMRHLHELLLYLGEALTWSAARPLFGDLQQALDETERLAEDVLSEPDVSAHRSAVAPLLRAASVLVRGPDRLDRVGADLVGADLRGVDLRGACLRTALLLAADLRGVDLRQAELLGAHLRDADIRGADLGRALYLTQMQVNAARGDASTRLPPRLDRPRHWT